MVTGDAAPGPDWAGHLLLLRGSEAERLAGLTAAAVRATTGTAPRVAWLDLDQSPGLEVVGGDP
jgi:hypothetical protein